VQRYTIRVEGLVQGVCFRAATCEQARRLGISGFVRNEPDGSVRIEAEGEPSALTQLVAWCHRGPPAAEVSAVTVETQPLQGLKGFSMRW
jgi:acylphosphatase